MENVTFVEITTPRGEVIETAIIDKGNGEFTSMLKTDYEEKFGK
jgi:hypothetical protein